MNMEIIGKKKELIEHEKSFQVNLIVSICKTVQTTKINIKVPIAVTTKNKKKTPLIAFILGVSYHIMICYYQHENEDAQKIGKKTQVLIVHYL